MASTLRNVPHHLLMAAAVGAFLFIGVPGYPDSDGGTPVRFSAICSDQATHGYRAGTDIAGKPMPDSWTTDERFNQRWLIARGEDGLLTIDGKRAQILTEDRGMIIAADVSSSLAAASAWTYAINLNLRRIVAAQVNTHGSGQYQGVKARVVELTCDFGRQGNTDAPR